MSHACAVCGTEVPPPFRVPRPELPPDLDGRPGEPARSTLPSWIASCLRCGASAPDLAALPTSAAATVRSDAYRALRTPGPAMPFLRHALIRREAGEIAEAAEATLQAAWALDDAGDDAADLRREAARLWGESTETRTALRLVDVLRRAGAFAEAEARAAALAQSGLDENSAAILAFERARIGERNAGCYQISSALRPPARRPHVTHQQPKREQPRGFWGRLFGV
jgi:hypothetical protein